MSQHLGSCPCIAGLCPAGAAPPPPRRSQSIGSCLEEECVCSGRRQVCFFESLFVPNCRVQPPSVRPQPPSVCPQPPSIRPPAPLVRPPAPSVARMDLITRAGGGCLGSRDGARYFRLAIEGRISRQQNLTPKVSTAVDCDGGRSQWPSCDGGKTLSRCYRKFTAHSFLVVQHLVPKQLPPCLLCRLRLPYGTHWGFTQAL